MSYSNEELVEELLWEAHEKGLGTALLDLSNELQSKEKLGRYDAINKAYQILEIKEMRIAKFSKKKDGSKFMVCYECETPIIEYWRMSDEEKRAADRQITIPAKYCDNCKTNI